jgi:tetratricopeptide (TPR) repeat protein
MTTNGVLVGEIAHIQGALPDSPRFNPDMTNEQRRGYDNLLLMCGTHHTIIDNDVNQWTLAKLLDLKRAHEIRGTVIGQAARDLRTSARVLPIEAMVADVPPFVGRETQLDGVGAALGAAGDPQHSIVIVSGPPGVGKTALLRQAATAAHAADDFEYVLFVDMRGYDEDPANRVRADAVFYPLLRSLGVDNDDIPPDDPADQARKYQEVMNQLAADHKPVLVWLDNVSERDQLDPLRPANPAHKLAVTTRETFGHIPRRQVVEVGLMSLEEAVMLLTASARDRNPEDRRFDRVDAVEQLAILCDRLPLALQIVAALLADEPDRPIEEFVNELTSEEDRLNGLHYSGDLSVRAALALSYRRLPDDLRRLFRLLSVVPGGDVGWDAAAKLIRASGSAVRQQLMALVRGHLVQQHVRNRWSMHDLVRLYSAEECASQPEDANAAFKRLVDRYLAGLAAAAEWLTAVVSQTARTLFPSAEQAAAWFQAEQSTAIAILMSIIGRPDYNDRAIVIGVSLGELLKSQKHWLQEFHDIAAVTASLAPEAQSRWMASCALNNYGSALRMLGDFDGAVRAFEQAVEINEERGDVNAVSLSRCNIANVHLEQGRIDDALDVYWQDVQISRESEPPHPYNEASSLTNIGGALAKAERFEEAVLPLRQGLAIRRELDDQPGIASSLLNLGGILSRLGQTQHRQDHLEEARVLLEEASRIHQVRSNRSGQADVANNLGQVQCLLGRYTQGFRNLEIAIDYFEQSGQNDLAAQVRDDLRRYRHQAGLN